jgi:hypothetical protein
MKPHFETGQPRTTGASAGVLSRVAKGIVDGMTILPSKFGARDLRVEGCLEAS